MYKDYSFGVFNVYSSSGLNAQQAHTNILIHTGTPLTCTHTHSCLVLLKGGSHNGAMIRPFIREGATIGLHLSQEKELQSGF